MRPVLCLMLIACLAAPAAAQSAASPSSIVPNPRPPSPPLSLNTFLGGVPSGTASQDTLTLTVLDAIARALQHNLGVLLAEQSVGQAEGARWRALSEVLPNVSGRVSETREKLNLAAFGFGNVTSGPFAGIPTIVGPFNVFDARVSLSQSVLDLGAINDVRSQTHLAEAARLTQKNAREFVINVAATVFLQTLAASARVEAARAQLATAEALFKTATDLKQSGMVPAIDVLRAQVELSTERQRATSAQNEFEKAKLQLAHVVGLPLGQPFTLDANLPELPTADLSVDRAVDEALKNRTDYQAARERVRAAEAARAAIVGEALPSVHVNADYGDIGLSPSDAQTTFTLIGALNVPIFQGGRTRGRLMEADAELRTRQSELDDLKAGIYYEVHTAFLDLQATSEQLRVATQGRDLAAQQLAQARDRFSAGVASNIEVIQAQEAVAVANEQFIAAQYGFDLAKGAVIRGIGSAEAVLRTLLGGSR